MTEAGRGPAGSGRSSFTLVEILVATAILSLLLFLLFSFTVQTNKAWQQGLARIERRQNDRMALNFITTELQFASVSAPLAGTNGPVPVTYTNHGTSIATNLPPYQFVINPAGVSANNAQSVFWQAPIATTMTNGLLAEVGYCVTWTNAAAGFEADLLRFFLNPPAPSDNTASIYTTPLAWISDAILSAQAPADAANNYQGLFAEDVYALWVRALDAYGNPITANASGSAYAPYAYDSRQGYTDSQGAVHPPPALPAMVEIALVSSDARTTRRLGAAYPAAAFVTSATNFWSDIGQYVSNFPSSVRGAVHVYSTRVGLSNSH